MRRTSIALIELVLIPCILILAPASGFGAKICPDSLDSVEKLASEKLAVYEPSFAKEDRHIFFVGLWSKLEPAEKTELSAVFHKEDKEMVEGIRQMMTKLSSRLLQDREKLSAWVVKNHLETEVEVQSTPADGSFLLVKSTRKGMVRILCASFAGELPALLTDLGY